MGAALENALEISEIRVRQLQLDSSIWGRAHCNVTLFMHSGGSRRKMASRFCIGLHLSVFQEGQIRDSRDTVYTGSEQLEGECGVHSTALQRKPHGMYLGSWAGAGAVHGLPFTSGCGLKPVTVWVLVKGVKRSVGFDVYRRYTVLCLVRLGQKACVETLTRHSCPMPKSYRSSRCTYSILRQMHGTCLYI